MASQAFLEQAYLAYFGRPVDPVGLFAFKGSTEEQVYTAFFESAESRSLYGDGFGPTQINAIYQMLFGRDAEPAGVDYWVNQINLGLLTPAGAALGILNGARNSDAVAVQNKLAASSLFTASMDTIAESSAYVGNAAAEFAREFLKDVTTFPATQNQINTALESLVEQANSGVIIAANTFTLTENVIPGDIIDVEPTAKVITYVGFNPTALTVAGADAGGVPLYDIDNLGNPVTYSNENGTANPVFAGGGTYVVQKGLVSYIKDLTGLDFIQLGLINIANGTDDGLNNGSVSAAGDSSIQITGDATVGTPATGDVTGDNSTSGSVTVTITATSADGAISTAEAQISDAYFKLLTDLVLDANGNMRLYEKVLLVYPQQEITAGGVTFEQNLYQYQDGSVVVPIILTPTLNNGGTEESGVTSARDDLIVAARLELLHGAYIDAGGGVNTLEIDAKGYFAQPKELLNIQHIKIENLPNVYTDGSGDNQYPDIGAGTNFINSIIDITRAIDIETLTVTESAFQGMSGEALGSLTVTGIRNGAEVTLDGSFTQNVYLNFGELQGNGVDLVLNNVNFGVVGGQSSNKLVVAHNSNTLNIESIGGDNYISNGDLVGSGEAGGLSTLNISGDAHLFIEGDLNPSFHNNYPAVIDASANTAGVSLVMSGTEKVTFIGSQANDRFIVSTADANDTTVGANGNDDSVTITALNGDNHFEVASTKISLTAGNGDNNIELEGGDVATVMVGNGDNNINTNIDSAIVDLNITVGDGSNTIGTSTSDSVNIMAGNGGNTISVLNAADVTIISGSGVDSINVSAESITITSTGADMVTIVGTGSDYADSAATLKISLGAGATVNLGAVEEATGTGNDVGLDITAQEGSFISGTDLTLFVNTYADLRAATLSGISNIVLDDDYVTEDGSPTANESADRALLTLTDTQVSQLVASGVDVSVQGSIFNTSAHIKVIVTQNLDTTTGAWATWLAELPASVDLQFEINDGATLKLTAQQLHTKVAMGGVSISDDGNTDMVSGKVFITGAGKDFDPFNNSDQVRTTIDGREYLGGSLATGALGFADDADQVADGIQRDEWGVNVLLNRTLTGYNRPADAVSYSRLTIDTDEQGGSVGPFATIETFLRIVGDADMAFVPVKGGIDEWGAPTASGTAIELGIDNGEPTNTFMVDFSEATGEISNLTLAHFQNVDAVYGNGTTAAPARVNVEIDDDTSVASSAAGLVSRGVQTYVVTTITDPTGQVDAAQFWTCSTTEDLQTLGLRGNYADTITFGNTERGVDFLLEVAYNKVDGYAVGTLVADFARPEADAVFNVVGLSTLPTDEVQKVAGIDATDAATIVINVDGGNTVIESLDGADALSLTLTADADLTIDTDLMDALESINAAGVDGELTVAIDSPTAADIVFVGADGATSLTLTNVLEGDFASIGGVGDIALTIEEGVNLTATTLTNVTAVTLGDTSTLSLTVEQADDIGAANFALASGETATLNLQGLNDQVFALANYDVAGTLTITVTLAEEPVVTLNAATDLTGIAALVIPEGTTLYLTAAQYQQLDDEGDITGEGSIVITGLSQADVGEAGEDFDISGILLTGTLLLNGADSTISFELSGSVDLSAADVTGVDAITLGAGNMLTLGQISVADGVEITGGANSTLKFTDTTSSAADVIDASGFDVTTLMFTNTLTAGTETNIDGIFGGLAETITKVAYNGEGTVNEIDQVVDITAGTTVIDDLDFNPSAVDTELQTFTLNLLGGTEITGNLGLATATKFNNLDGDAPAVQDAGENDLIRTYLQKVTINSTGTAANLLSGDTENIINGSITGFGTADNAASQNNLLNIEINATQDLVVTGNVVFSSNVGADALSANNQDDAVAELTVMGTADVTLGGIDLADVNVDGLNLVNNSTGTVFLTVDAADAGEDLSFTGTGDVVLTVAGVSDLSDDVLTAVGQLTVAEEAEVTLTFAQVTALGVGNIVSGTTDLVVDETLTIVEYDGSAFDFSALSDALIINLAMSAGAITLAPTVDLTGVDSITVPEGGTLTLTAAQFEQLTGNGSIIGVDADGNPSTDFTVNITGLMQANVDLDVTAPAGTGEVGDGFKLTGVLADNITVSLAEDVNLDDNTALNGAALTIGGFALGLSDEAQADGLSVTGDATSVVSYLFDIVGPIEAAGYDIGTLRALAQSVDGEDVEFIIDNLASSIMLNLYEDPAEVGFVSPINRIVTIEEGVAVPAGDVAFNGQDGDREMRTLTINFTGDATDRTVLEDQDGNLEGSVIDGALILDREPVTGGLVPSFFQKLTLNSSGVGTSNAITGGITPIAQGVINPGATANADNNLLDIEINATSAFAIGGAVVFNSTDADLDEATLTVNGTADVSIQSLNVSDADIDVLNIVNNAGTLTLTGASTAINAAATESIVISGDGDVVIGTAEVAEDLADDIAGGSALSSIDASGLTGDLSIENITAVDVANFSFVSGTGVTTLRVSSSTLNDDDAPSTEPGWSFDLSDAAAGSQLTLGAALVWTNGDLTVDLGTNAVLYITADTDWTALDNVNITGTIVLAAGVDLTLTAAMADGLTIIPESSIVVDQNDGGFAAVDVPTVTITELGGAAYDFSDIMAGVQDSVGVANKVVSNAFLEDNDVTINALANLGDVAITLLDVADGVAINDDLAGQTVRFNTVAQAERIITVNAVNGQPSTNVVWLFNTVTAPVDTDNYDGQIARLWLTQAMANGANIEDLFTSLPTTIIRVDYADLAELEALLLSQAVQRDVELASFTNLPLGLVFNDQDVLEHVETLTISMGGQVVVGDLEIDNIIDNTATYASPVTFNSLTIESWLADDTGDLLAREGFDETVNVKPSSGNTFGDISVGTDNNIDLLTVNLNTMTDEAGNNLTTLEALGTVEAAAINAAIGAVVWAVSDVATEALVAAITAAAVTAGNLTAAEATAINAAFAATLVLNDGTDLAAAQAAAQAVVTAAVDNVLTGTTLTIGTITYETNDVGQTATLDITGENDITIAAINTADTGITGLTIDATGFTAVLDPVMHMDDTETLTITNGNVAAGTIILDEVEGNELSFVDATDFDGALQMTLSQIDSTNEDRSAPADGDTTDAVDAAFNFTAGAGVNTIVVKQVGTNVPTLATGSTWSFDMAAAAPGSVLTIDATTSLAAGSNLTVALAAGVLLNIDGNLNLSGVNLTVTGGAIAVGAGDTLTLSVAQVLALGIANVNVVGEGTVKVTGDATDAVAADLGEVLRTVNVDLSAVTLDLVAPGADADLQLDVVLLGALVDDVATLTVYDPTVAAGQSVVGSVNDDDIVTEDDLDNTLSGGTGNDTLTGGNDSVGALDTFNTYVVTAGTDVLVGLKGDGTVSDVVTVSSGATATATLVANFVATAASTNAGTVTLTGAANAATTIDVSVAGGANGFTLDGGASGVADDGDVLTGSDQNDIINGGNSAQEVAGDADTLTGNGGDDTFLFNVEQSAPVQLAQAAGATVGDDLERWDFNPNAAPQATAFAADVANGSQAVTVLYRSNQTASSFSILDDGTIDFTDGDAIATRIASELSTRGVAATYDTANDLLDLNGIAGQSVEILSITPTAAWAVPLDAPIELAGYDVANDVEHEVDVTIGDGTVGVVTTAGERYAITVTLAEGAAVTFEYTALGTETEAVLAGALEAGLLGLAGGAFTTGVVGNVITVTDANGDNGGFTVSLDNNPGISGTGASALGAGAGVWADIFADTITEFVSGDDLIQLGIADGTNANYREAAVETSYLDAYNAANTEMDGTVLYYLTSIDGSTGTEDATGLLFFDANADGEADGVILLTGISSGNFDETDIIFGG